MNRCRRLFLKGYNVNNDFYVYAHITQDTNQIFYIGKGRKRRAWAFQKRNKFWKAVASKHGVVVQVLHYELTEQQAFDIETQLIDELGRRDAGCGYLVNMTNGGEGVAGYKPTADVLKKKSRAIKGRTFITADIAEMQKAYDSGLTTKEVAKQFDVCQNTVLKYVKTDTSRKLKNLQNGVRFKKGQKVWNKGNGTYIEGSKNPFYGRKHGAETRRIMSEKKKKHYERIDCQAHGVI